MIDTVSGMADLLAGQILSGSRSDKEAQADYLASVRFTAAEIIEHVDDARALAESVAEAALTDPMLKAIAEYRAGMALFNQIARGLPDDQLDALAERTYDPPRRRLVGDCPEPTTYPGVIAAIEMAEDEDGDIDLVAALVRGAARFFRRHRAGQPATIEMLRGGAGKDATDAKVNRECAQ